jgi:hypothetical protein
MKRSRKIDPAFRTAFILLVSTSFVLLVWQCTRRPPGPARIDLHSAVPGKP